MDKCVRVLCACAHACACARTHTLVDRVLALVWVHAQASGVRVLLGCTSKPSGLERGGPCRGWVPGEGPHPSLTPALPQGWLSVLALLGTLALCRSLRRPGSPPQQPPVRCYGAGELRDGEAPAHLLARSLRWDRYAPVQLVPQLERLEAAGHRRRRRHERGCPAFQLRAGLRSEPNERSISPWRYR